MELNRSGPDDRVPPRDGPDKQVPPRDRCGEACLSRPLELNCAKVLRQGQQTYLRARRKDVLIPLRVFTLSSLRF